MSNAAIYLHPDGYNTATQSLMGRHSAGESFLRGFLRHAEAERFYFWNVGGRKIEDLRDMVLRIHPSPKPRSWILQEARDALSNPGVVYLPIPEIGQEAWRRWPHGRAHYSLCGITHTTATARAMDAVSQLITMPTEEWDGLICTSNAVRQSVELELEAVQEFQTWQFGPRRTPHAQLATIPLGVNTDDFSPTAQARVQWRERLNIAADDIVVLYVGRFNAHGKMNPALMAQALERAASLTPHRLHWLNSGWGETDAFHDAAAKFCPSVTYHHVDGRDPATRFSIWSAGDLFISFSDNIQETYGLTPLEAMAAGLPCVVTDWDGYRDTVRHGVDGFRVPTYAPPPGSGRGLAEAYDAARINYDTYVGAAAQVVSIDLATAAQAVADLANNSELRRQMGDAGRRRAKEEFDWSTIIPRYQAFWGELQARRASAQLTPNPVRENPWRMDPFRLFQGYPTKAVQHDMPIIKVAGLTWDGALERLRNPLAQRALLDVPTGTELKAVFDSLQPERARTLGDVLNGFPQERRRVVERGIMWMIKFGVLAFYGPSLEIRP